MDLGDILVIYDQLLVFLNLLSTVLPLNAVKLVFIFC